MWTPLFRPYVSWRLFPAISLQLLQFFGFCMTLIIMVSMLESYFDAIRYFKKIINYQSEETSCLAYTWDGLVLEVWNIPSINRCDLGHQFPYIKPRGRNRFYHLILYQPLRSDDIFHRLCAFFFNLNQVFRSQRPLTKEQQYNRQDYTGMSDLHLFLWFDTLRSILLSCR